MDLDAAAGKVVTDGGTVSAEVIVVASHIPFVDTGGYFARMTPSRSYAVAFRSPGEPPSGMYISVDQPIRSIRSTGDGYTIVGGEAHPSGARRGHRRTLSGPRHRGPRTASERRSVDYRWSAQDYRSVDGLPFVGPLGSSGRVFTATGFAKWGMANGTVAAAIMVDLAMGRDNPLASVFDSKRSALKQAAPGLLKAGAGFAKSLLTDRVLPLGSERVGAPGPRLWRRRVNRWPQGRCLPRRGRNRSRRFAHLHSPRLPGAVQQCGADLGLPVSWIAFRRRRQGDPWACRSRSRPARREGDAPILARLTLPPYHPPCG